MAKQPSRDADDTPGRTTAELAAQIVARLVQQIGLLGTIFILLFLLFVIQGSREQHREFIDLYILAKHGCAAPILLVIVACLATIASQRVWHQRIIAMERAENRRIGAQKSALQEVLTARELRHTGDEKRRY